MQRFKVERGDAPMERWRSIISELWEKGFPFAMHDGRGVPCAFKNEERCPEDYLTVWMIENAGGDNVVNVGGDETLEFMANCPALVVWESGYNALREAGWVP